MPKINICIPHTLGREVALERLRGKRQAAEGFEQAGGKILEEAWNDDCYHLLVEVMGSHVTLDIVVADAEATASVNLPFTLVFIQGMVRNKLETELKALLS
ncbi:MAG: polyhydroxyalkanoic acid system family protein [Thermoguttaceae bacterium]|nr:polyhydroxyalkanoic acid system family protein [Thermoguttaceae bacterium]